MSAHSTAHPKRLHQTLQSPGSIEIRFLGPNPTSDATRQKAAQPVLLVATGPRKLAVVTCVAGQARGGGQRLQTGVKAADQSGNDRGPAGFAVFNRTAQEPAEIDRRTTEHEHPVAGPREQVDHQPTMLLDADHNLARLTAKVGEQPMQLPQPPPPLPNTGGCHNLTGSIQHAHRPASGVEAGKDHCAAPGGH